MLVIGTLIAAVLIALALFAVRQKGNGADANAGKTINFDLTGKPVLGTKGAPVTVVVFEDFKCPNCKRFEEEFLPTLKSKYIDTGKAKFVSLNYPFLAEKAQLPVDDSKLAAQAAECAYRQGGNDVYERMKQVLFRAQGSEEQVWADKTRLKDLAGNVEGLDTAKFATCLDGDATAAAVDADEQQGNKAAVPGTPAIYVNGKLLPTYDADTVGQAIDAASTSAQQ